MKIILNHHIVFDFDAGTVTSAESQDDPIQISNPAKRLLYLLLSHPGEVVSREMLFKKVWDDFGMVSSNNNLNQCISKLRRILRNFNQDNEIIITVPKVGFMLHRQVIVEELTENSSPVANESLLATLPSTQIATVRPTRQFPHRYLFYGLFTATVFALIIGASIIWFNLSYQHSELYIGQAGNCNVKTAENIPNVITNPATKNALLRSVQRLNLDCRREQYILLMRSEPSHSRNWDISRYHLLVCEQIAESGPDICWAPQPVATIN